jgi:hypothetical protein
MRRRRESRADPLPAEVRVGDLLLQQDVTAADWVVRGVHDGRDLGSFIPAGFDTYVRVLHPFHRWDGDQLASVSWAEVASVAGATFHRQVQWDRIASSAHRNDRPLEGTLPRDLVERLVPVLAAHTSKPDLVWFGTWEGFAGLRFVSDDSSSSVLSRRRLPMLSRRLSRRRFSMLLRHRIRLRSRFGSPPPAPRFHLPHGRAYYLLRGTIDGASESLCRSSWQSANLWWPDDHAWIVATEIDSRSTYIGGTRECIEEILANPGFEAVPADIHDRIGRDADTINPPPPNIDP